MSLPIIISFGSLVFSIMTFCISFYIERNKMTIEAYRSLQIYLYKFYEYPKGEIEEFVSAGDNEEYKALSTALAEIEFFSTGVRSGIYNKRVVYKMAHGYLDGTLRGGIEHMIELKNRYPDRKGFYNDTLWLLKKMDKKSKIR